MENKFCIVIKTCERDALDYLQLIQDLERVSAYQVFVTVPQSQLASFARMTPSHVTLLSDKEILTAYGVGRDVEDTWETQQLLKLLCVGLVDYEACLVLDANTMVRAQLKPTLFMQAGCYSYDLDDSPSLSGKLWHDTSHQFLGLFPKPRYFRAVNQVLLKNNVLGLFQYLERRYQASAASMLLAACLLGSRRQSPLWTEYALYGAYVANLPDNGGHVFDRKLHIMYYTHDKHGQSVDNFMKEVREQRPEMLKIYRHRPRYMMDRSAYLALRLQLYQDSSAPRL